MTVNVFAADAGDSLSLSELDLYKRINAYRVANGLGQLQLSKGLSTTANRHVLDLADRGAFEHGWGSSTGLDQWGAARALTGYPDTGYEVLAGTADPDAALRGWQGSAPHNAQLLEGAYRVIGIGTSGGLTSVYLGVAADPAGPPLIVGDGAANAATLTAFADNAQGLGGADTLAGGDGADTLAGGQGGDLLLGNAGEDLLLGNTGADTLFGGRDADTLFGGVDDDVLFGDAGDDLLSGDVGDDRLTGGGGADHFAFGAGSGRDTITDFNAGEGDRIRLSGIGYTLSSNAAGDTVIVFSAKDQVTLSNIAAGAFDTAWIAST
ncbi:CAP domain-containing protein [Azospirillum sp. sgz301742]